MKENVWCSFSVKGGSAGRHPFPLFRGHGGARREPRPGPPPDRAGVCGPTGPGTNGRDEPVSQKNKQRRRKSGDSGVLSERRAPAQATCSPVAGVVRPFSLRAPARTPDGDVRSDPFLDGGRRPLRPALRPAVAPTSVDAPRCGGTGRSEEPGRRGDRAALSSSEPKCLKVPAQRSRGPLR